VEPGGNHSRRLTLFYAALAILVVGACIVVFSVGADREPEPSVAGQYELEQPDECLGELFNLRQSGQFGVISTPSESATGSVRIEGGELSGEVDCQDAPGGVLEATAGEDEITGSIGGTPFTAQREGDPAPAASQSSLVPNSIAGEYALSPTSACLGSTIEIEDGSGSTAEIHGSGGLAGEIEYEDGDLTGSVICSDGVQEVTLQGTAAGRELQLELESEAEGAAAPVTERIEAVEQREFGATLATFFAALVVVMIAARLFGSLATRLGQPRVMGEVVAGIALGPTIFGAIAPQLQATVFPADLIPAIGIVANLGLVFYMFMVGIELDPAQLKGRFSQALAISNASVAIPMVLGIAVAIPTYELVGPDTEFAGFALFMGVAMSITAFPVLARILVERRMLTRPLGATAMTAAAIDDVTAWFLIALATAIAVSGSTSEVFVTIALAIAFCLLMLLVVRPIIGRVSGAYDEAGRIPPGWLAILFAGVLLSAFATEEIGIALIFGAFLMGMIMPRRADLTEDVTGRLEDFVVIVLLPLFFAYTGLRTNIGLLDQPELWLLTGVLLLVAITGKFAGAMIAARVTGLDWRGSAVIGTLMNTRGLTELIVLNLALELGVISEALFAALVIMALVTTFMAGPLLRLLDPKNSYGEPVEEELGKALAEAETSHPGLATPDRAILLAPQSAHGMEQLLPIASLLAKSEPPREVIVAQQVQSSRGTASGVRAGLQTDARLLAEASSGVESIRDELVAAGVAARSVAYISANPADDLQKISSLPEIDLVLLDGRKQLRGGAVPGGEAHAILRESPSDVAALIARDGMSLELTASEKPILVPFGGAEHDWAALELGAWISAASGAPLRLFGAAGTDAETSELSRLLGDASLLIQQYAGVVAQPHLSEPGRGAVMRAAEESSLVVVGLPGDWEREGLGRTRTALAESNECPVLFVRRGTRPGSLAPASDVTGFSWSTTRFA